MIEDFLFEVVLPVLLWTCGLLVVGLLVLLCFKIYQSDANPCVKSVKERCTYYMMAGKVMVPVQGTCNRCVERTR